MKNIKLARKVLRGIEDTTIECDVWASEGGACSDGWNDTTYLELSKEQVLYLIKKPEYDNLYTDLKTDPVDVDEVLEDLAHEGAWPDGGASARVTNPIPVELKEIEELLKNLNRRKKSDVENVKSKLREIKDGNYTFYFDISSDGYYFGEGEEEQIFLTSQEALGLLYGAYKYKSVFGEFEVEPLDEDFINDKASDDDMASDYDNFSYGYDEDRINLFIQAWQYLIDNILSGDIKEDDLEGWLEYFDDCGYEDGYAIEEWHEENHSDE